MGWYTDYQMQKMEQETKEALEKLEIQHIQDRNMMYALQTGIINWFQYLEYFRVKKEIELEDEKKAA